jgi:hypothetical protein
MLLIRFHPLRSIENWVRAIKRKKPKIFNFIKYQLVKLNPLTKQIWDQSFYKVEIAWQWGENREKNLKKKKLIPILIWPRWSHILLSKINEKINE